MGRSLFLLSMAGALGVALGSMTFIAGTCNGIERRYGARFQEGQDAFSLWEKDGLPIAHSSEDTYVRLGSTPTVGTTVRGQYLLDFSEPIIFGDMNANTLTLELSALVEKGSGDHWEVALLNSNTHTWDKIGDLSEVGSKWTTSTLTVISDDGCSDEAPSNKRCVRNCMDKDNNNQVLVRIHTFQLDQVVFIDYAHIKASFGFNPHTGHA